MMFGRLDEWEPKAGRGGVRRYGYVLVSLAVHVVLIVLLYYFGAYQVQMALQREQESASAAVARQSGIEKRVMDMEKIKVRSGVVEGRKIDAAGVKTLAKLPGLQELRATLLGMFNQPASRLVRTIAEPGATLARVIQARADKQ